MSAATPITWTEHTADEVHALAKHCRDAKQASRARAIAMIMDGASRTEAARAQGLELQQVKRASWLLGREFGRAPATEEIAERTGMPLDKVQKALEAAAAAEPMSLETPLGSDDGDLRLGDLIEDEDAVQPLDAAIGSDLRDTVSRVLGTLTPREERVLRMRFGIGTKSDHTLGEVGQQFSVSRERIRQIEARALHKLKHPARARVLRSFLEGQARPGG